jgi:hypothetical protein
MLYLKGVAALLLLLSVQPAPQPISPSGLSPNPLVFRWKAVSGADAYRVTVYTVPSEGCTPTEPRQASPPARKRILADGHCDRLACSYSCSNPSTCSKGTINESAAPFPSTINRARSCQGRARTGPLYVWHWTVQALYADGSESAESEQVPFSNLETPIRAPGTQPQTQAGNATGTIALPSSCAGGPGSGAPGQRITAYVSNHSTFAHTYTFCMVGCKPGCCYKNSWTISLQPGAEHDLGLCSNKALSDGYGEFYYKDDQSSHWTHEPQIRSGKKIPLY